MKIGIVGLGHLGQIHLKCLKETHFEIVACYDLDSELSRRTAELLGVPVCSNYEDLLARVDVVDIVSSSNSHFELAELALTANKHVFIEKPFVQSSAEGTVLMDLANSKDLKVQIGHVERYNPAVLALDATTVNPKFIEAHRLAMFNPRGTDVSVVMDLMIHDLDLICHFVKSKLLKVDASGVNVVSDSPDICSARLTFENGTVANLTASRISLKNMRKFRIFEPSQYISLDLIKKQSQRVKISDHAVENSGSSLSISTAEGLKYVSMELLETELNNAIVEELKDFCAAIKNQREISVDLLQALRSLKMAERILSDVNINNQKVVNA